MGQMTVTFLAVPSVEMAFHGDEWHAQVETDMAYSFVVKIEVKRFGIWGKESQSFQSSLR